MTSDIYKTFGFIVGIVFVIIAPFFIGPFITEHSPWKAERNIILQEQALLKISSSLISLATISENEQTVMIDGTLSKALIKENGTADLPYLFPLTKEETDWLFHDFQLALPFSGAAKSKYIYNGSYTPTYVEDIPLNNTYIVDTRTAALEILKPISGNYTVITKTYYNETYHIDNYIEVRNFNDPYVIGNKGNYFIVENPQTYLGIMLRKGAALFNDKYIFVPESQKEFQYKSFASSSDGHVGFLGGHLAFNTSGIISGEYLYGGPLVRITLKEV
jgi:hypothetical protein